MAIGMVIPQMVVVVMIVVMVERLMPLLSIISQIELPAK